MRPSEGIEAEFKARFEAESEARIRWPTWGKRAEWLAQRAPVRVAGGAASVTGGAVGSLEVSDEIAQLR